MTTLDSATTDPAQPDADGAPEPSTGVSVTVNGVLRTASVPDATLLVDWLRDDLRLTGTRTGCDTAVCGACTVLLDGRAVKSCTVLAVQADGLAVTTVEGLAPDGVLTPLQRAFQRRHAVQCGFCTAGFLMAATGLPDGGAGLNAAGIRQALKGNLCRCTGYQAIVEAVLDAAKETWRDDT